MLQHIWVSAMERLRCQSQTRRSESVSTRRPLRDRGALCGATVDKNPKPRSQSRTQNGRRATNVHDSVINDTAALPIAFCYCHS
uniref:Uncharacterized protein n=1 Tax=Knipowitschia caucasica TaxID=637954 RepID=A0AAV2KJ50_KNICA